MRVPALSIGTVTKIVTVVVVLAALSQQFFHAFNCSIGTACYQEDEITELHRTPIGLEASNSKRSRTRRTDSFGACLMVKGDNDLLYEWLAYHYTVLPLRHVVIGSDIGNPQDPAKVLQRWTDANTDLRYWTLSAGDFIHRHGNRTSNNHEDEKDKAHHELIHRQKGFLTTCSELLKKEGVKWTLYIDSDEFVVFNRLGNDDKLLTIGGNGHDSINNVSYQIRRNLPNADSSDTLLDAIQRISKHTSHMGSCYTLPRLIVGSLENQTCADASEINAMAKREYDFGAMSTLRFVQHAKKGDFANSKFGKVMIDLSNLTAALLAQKLPNNIHRPFREHCGPGFVHFPNAFVYLNHYIGSWERYSSREDNRRNRKEWEQRAYFNVGTVCDKAIYRWFPRFVQMMGDERAKFLLGVHTLHSLSGNRNL